MQLRLDSDEVVHKIDLIEGIDNGIEVMAKVNVEKRNLVSANHSTAHLLYDTLWEKFPTSIGKGYYNDETGLRIDMWIEEELTPEKIKLIHNSVTEKIASNSAKEEIITDAKTVKDQYKLNISFGNKDLEGDLRIVKFGEVSIQLCSGTHVENTQDIPEFFIHNVESKGNNIYRFYAKTTNEQINIAIKQTLEQEETELNAIISKYETSKSLLKNVEIEKLIEQVNPKNITKSTFSQWKMDFALLKEKIKEHYINFEKVKRELYIEKYSLVPFNLIDGINYAVINDDLLDSKDMKFLADWILKNKTNSIVELVNLKDKSYFCKSNSSKSAIDVLRNHSSLNIKGGGNEKTAQGKIS